MRQNVKHSLEEAKRLITHWRTTRTKRRPIPESVWDAILPLIGQYTYSAICSELVISYQQINNKDDDKTFINAWRTTYPSLSGELHLSRENIELSGGTLQFVVLSSQQWTPVFIWIFNSSNTNYYFLVRTEKSRLRRDIQELKRLFKDLFLPTIH